MQPASLTGRQQQLGLLMGRSQPDVLEAARVAALLNGQSGSFGLQSGLGSAGLGSGVLAGLGGTSAGLNLGLGPLPQPSQQVQQASQLDQLALLSQFPHALFPPQQYSSTDRDLHLSGLRNVGKTRSSDSRSSSAYASRHQAAEQRRRTRINERLELLRKLVPHAERANTACFLEEVIKYIENLKRRTMELEAMLEAATGKPVVKSLAPQGVPAGSSLTALEPAPDTQAPSPRQPPPPARQLSGPHLQANGGPNSSASPLAPPAAPSLGGTQTLQLPSHQVGQQQQDLGPQQQQAGLDTMSGGATGGGGASAAGGSANAAAPQPHRQSPQLQLSPALSSQLAHLLPGAGATAGQAGGALGALFPHTGGSLSLPSGSLSLGGGGAGASALSLSQLAGLQHHGGGILPPHGASHAALTSSSSHGITQQQLNELHTIQAMHSLQQQHVRAAAAAAAAAAGGAGGLGSGVNTVHAHSHAARHHPPVFHPTNNKAFLHFNEDLFGGIKPELLPSRSLLGAAASTTPSTSLQLTSAHLPTDSNTLLQVETARKTLSGSPVSSEESGVPLKKRKVLLL